MLLRLLLLRTTASDCLSRDPTRSYDRAIFGFTYHLLTMIWASQRLNSNWALTSRCAAFDGVKQMPEKRKSFVLPGSLIYDLCQAGPFNNGPNSGIGHEIWAPDLSDEKSFLPQAAKS